MVVFLPRNKISNSDWNACIEASSYPNPYASSYYLDLVSPNWGALVMLHQNGVHGYEYVMPLPFEKKIISIIRQSPYCFTLGVFGKPAPSEAVYTVFLEYLISHFSFVSEYRFYESVPPHLLKKNSGEVKPLRNQVLPIGASYNDVKAGYNLNRRRDLKKAASANLQINYSGSLETFIALFDRYTRHKIYSFEPSQIDGLRNTVKLLQEVEKVSIVEVMQADEVIASAIFHEKGAMAYLSMASNSPAAAATGASTFLLDRMIQKFVEGPVSQLSFNGSDEAGIASFYASFGARDQYYSFIRYSRLPTFVNALLSLRRKLFFSGKQK